jgi:formyl-CoA transferase
MFDVLADWMNMPLLAHRYMGGAPARSGLKHSFISPYGAFECCDGSQVLISVQSNREFAALCSQVLERPELPRDPRFSENPERYAHRDALDAIVAACFAKFTAAEMVDKLDAAQIANAQLNSVADLSEHPFLRNSVAQIGDCEVSLAALPVTSQVGAGQSVPNLGAQSDALRAEFKA